MQHRLEDVLLEHYFQTTLGDRVWRFPVRLAVKYAAHHTPCVTSFARVIEFTPLANRLKVFGDDGPGLVRFTYKHTQERGFAYIEGISWTAA